MSTKPRYMRIPDAARHIAVSERSLKLRLQEGRIAARKDGTAVLVDVESLEAYADSLPTYKERSA